MSDTPNANPASPGGRQIPPWRWLLSFPLQGAHSFQADEVYALLQPHRPIATICEFTTEHGRFIAMVGVHKLLTSRDPEDVRDEIMASIMGRVGHIDFYMLYDSMLVVNEQGFTEYRRAHFHAYNNYRPAPFHPLHNLDADVGRSGPADTNTVDPVGTQNTEEQYTWRGPMHAAPQLAPELTLSPVDDDDGRSTTLHSWNEASTYRTKEAVPPAPTPPPGYTYYDDGESKIDKSAWPDAYRNDYDGPSHARPSASAASPDNDEMNIAWASTVAATLARLNVEASATPALNADDDEGEWEEVEFEDDDDWDGLYD